MSTTTPSTSAPHHASKTIKTGLTILVWGFVIFLGLRFYFKDAFPYFNVSKETYGSLFWPRWGWLLMHLFGGSLALLMGPLQFWWGLRKKALHIHRWAGRLYLTGILIGVSASFYLAATSPVGWAWSVSLSMLGVAWLVTSGMAYLSIRSRRIQVHKEWMIHSYVVTFSFVSFRVLVDLPFVVDLGSFPERAPTMVWLSWVVPLLVAEVILQWKRTVGTGKGELRGKPTHLPSSRPAVVRAGNEAGGG
ncbi:MAG: DUF2306 domain-containing protein [bacterium]